MPQSMQRGMGALEDTPLHLTPPMSFMPAETNILVGRTNALSGSAAF